MRELRFLIPVVLLILSLGLSAQVVQITPTFPTIEDELTIIFDASEGNGELAGESPVYGHMGLITDESMTPTDWQFVQGEWGTDDPTVLMTDLGDDLHQIVVDMDAFYGFPDGTEVLQLAFVFRNEDGSLVGRAEDGADIFYDVYPVGASLQATLLTPTSNIIVELGETIEISGEASSAADLSIRVDGSEVASETNATTIMHSLEVTEDGTHEVTLHAENGGLEDSDSFLYTVVGDVELVNPPGLMKDGINYLSPSSILLQLHAPEKDFVYVIGDFNNWTASNDYLMHLADDMETWWLQIDGLTPAEKVAYQYWVDGEIKVADPLSPVVLDPFNDGLIPSDVYPEPHPYPGQLTTGFCTVAEPGATPYDWQVTDFERPQDKDLIIYELLVRDFVADHSYLTLIDTLDYLENLGINAIELMPPGEFEGNDSWGYNPSFHMALDKYYGTPEMFKQFVDACHERGIAVIVDMVLNHAFGQSPLSHLYWDAGAPAANNPWLNVDCPHPPFCWGSDMDHFSDATQRYIDRVNSYWLDEYNIDGFRFDYTGGFTNTPGNSYDAARIAVIQRMANVVWDTEPGAYVILEHWAGNDEETELSNAGMLLWGNVTHQYQEAAMGYTANSNFEWGIYLQRGWNDPHLISYMESHDEERVSYKTLMFGNSEGDYDTQEMLIAMNRNALNAVFYFPQPGPKMIWQFGELGYDISIDYDCRVCPKPILWNYYEQNWRKRVYDVYSAMCALRHDHPNTFNTAAINHSLGGAFKRINLYDAEMDAVIIGNFGVEPISGLPNFPYTGTWYEYFSGESIEENNLANEFLLAPGEYRIYTSVALETPDIQVGLQELSELSIDYAVFPSIVSEGATLEIDLGQNLGLMDVYLLDAQGKIIARPLDREQRSGMQRVQVNMANLASGQYHLLVAFEGAVSTRELVKE